MRVKKLQSDNSISAAAVCATRALTAGWLCQIAFVIQRHADDTLSIDFLRYKISLDVNMQKYILKLGQVLGIDEVRHARAAICVSVAAVYLKLSTCYSLNGNAVQRSPPPLLPRERSIRVFIIIKCAKDGARLQDKPNGTCRKELEYECGA